MGNCQCSSKDDPANPYLCRPSQIIWQSEFAKEVADAVVADADDADDPLAYFPGRISSNGATKVASLFTQQGRKGINQDAMLLWEDFGSCEDTIFCGVFDGHGPYGHHVAQTIRDSLPSKLFCQWHASLTHRKQDSEVQLSNVHNEYAPKMNDLNGIISCEANKGFRDALDCNDLSQEPDSISLWRELHVKAFKVMDKELQLHPTLDSFCSGATAVTVIKQGRDLIIANVGDSRAIIATQDDDGTLIAEQLTVDLKPNLPVFSQSEIAALLNARVLWPRCARFLFNSYRGCAPLFVRGSTELLYSKEGVTQGDPLSMAFYGLSVLPLIDLLSDPEGRQSWFADDSSCCAKFLALRRWWDLLVLHGPSFGYHPEPQKSVLIVHPSLLREASRLFRDVGIKVVTSSRFLGGYIGNEEGKRSFLEEKVKVWTNSLLKLSEAAISQPQAAFAAVSKSLQCEWGFIQRVVSGTSEFFEPIQKAIEEVFFPALLGGPISSAEASIFSLPAKLGGLGIRDPVKTGDLSFRTSQEGTLVLSEAIKNLGAFDMNNHNATLNTTLSKMKGRRDEIHKEVLHRALDSLPPTSKRAIGRATHNKNSAWLTVLPIARHHFDLSANEFRDGLALRYMRLANLPAICDGCGDAFNIDHALNCKTGGLIIGRHNEIRDAIGDLAAQAWGHSNVWKEPIIQEGNQVSGIKGLQADLAVRGVWEPQGDALFDIRVVNTDAPSYRTRSVDAVLKSAAHDKKNKYGSACEERHSSFTPLVLSVDGVLEQEASGFIRRIADRLATKWDKSFGVTMGWVRARLTFAILRATSMCLRGTRVRWRCLGFEDGAGIGFSLNK